MRKSATWFAVAAMLFAQLAVAAHACQALSGADAAALPAAEHGNDEGLPCNEMQSQPANICLQHCADSPQSFDQHPVASVVPFAGSAYHVGRSDRLAVFLQSAQSHSHALLARVTAPPLSVRNCCFRI